MVCSGLAGVEVPHDEPDRARWSAPWAAGNVGVETPPDVIRHHTNDFLEKSIKTNAVKFHG